MTDCSKLFRSYVRSKNVDLGTYSRIYLVYEPLQKTDQTVFDDTQGYRLLVIYYV